MEKWAKHLDRIQQIQKEGRDTLARSTQQEERTVSTVAPHIAPETPLHARLEDLRQAISHRSSSTAYRNALSNLMAHQSDIRRFIDVKWQDITSGKRVYGLSPGKTYTVQVSLNVLRHLELRMFEFCQGDSPPAAVAVNVTMHRNMMFPCALEASGHFRMDHRLLHLFPEESRSGYRLLLHLATVVHYADLVIPIQQEQSERHATHATRAVQASENTRADRTVTKYIPRLPKSDPTGSGSSVPTRASSFVDAHRRRLPRGQQPSFQKIIEADQFGINLQGPHYPEVQYTFVQGHARGGAHPPEYLYKHGYRAIRSLEHMFDALGFPREPHGV
jgi:hypothetical protein